MRQACASAACARSTRSPHGAYCPTANAAMYGRGSPYAQRASNRERRTMPTVDWYFDFISPFSYLQSERLDTLGSRASIRLRPVLFAAILSSHAQKGPAEIPAKRAFTYRFVLWRASQMGIPLKFPPEH